MRIPLVTLFALTACGGTETTVTGDPLLLTTVTGQFNNTPFSPRYGFARVEGASFTMYIGSEKISCADDFTGDPRNGTYAAVSVTGPAMMGTFADASFEITQVIDGTLATQTATGTAQVTSVSATEVAATYSFSTTIDAGRYELLGSATMLHCP